MKSGFRTSEFAVTAGWWGLTAVVAIVPFFLPWPHSLAMAPCTTLLVYMSGMIANNYSENRWQMKAGKALREQEQQGEKPAFGFGRYVASEAEAESQEEE